MKRWILVGTVLATCGITGSLWGSQASGSAQEQSTVKTKVLHFPKDQCLGALYVDSNPDPARPDPTSLALSPTCSTKGSEFVGMAKGDVVVPADRKICLHMAETSLMDLSCLFRLDPNDLYRIEMSSWIRASKADDRILMPISHLTGLRVLTLGNTGVTSRGVRYINELHSLRALELHELWIGDTGLAMLQDLLALEYLDCDTGITDAGMKYLRQLSNLRWLRLRTGKIQGPGLADLAYIPHLERLCLWGETGLTDRHISYLQGLTHLKGLTIWGDYPLTDRCLESIGKLTDLEDLTFIRVKTLTDDGLAYLKGLKNLKKVDFGMSRIGDEGNRHLTALPDLESIRIVMATSEGMGMLSSFPNLKSLDVRWMGPRKGQRPIAKGTTAADLPSIGELLSPGIKQLARLQSLEELTLYGSSCLSEDDLRFLESLGRLKRLLLSEVPGTSKVMASISKLRQLESLFLDTTRMTKGDLNQLNCLTNLASLDVHPREQPPDGSKLDLSGLTNLRRLDLVGLSLQDGDLACLSAFQDLEWLNVGGKISEEGLRYIKDLSEIRTLWIGGLSCSTGDGLAYLEGLKQLQSLRLYGLIPDVAVSRLASLSPALFELIVQTPEPIQAKTIVHVRESLPRIINNPGGITIDKPPRTPTRDEWLTEYYQRTQKQPLQIKTDANRKR